jgi:hypothetical protein
MHLILNDHGYIEDIMRLLLSITGQWIGVVNIIQVY